MIRFEGRSAVLALIFLGVLAGTASARTGLRPATSADSTGTDRAATAGRVASLLELSAKEYRLGVAGGRVVQPAEYEEASMFLGEARSVFGKLTAAGGPPPDGGRVATELDSLAGLLHAKAGPDVLAAQVRRTTGLLRELWGATALAAPASPPSAARGAALFRGDCASCHGTEGRGDGPLAAEMDPPPADLADPGRHESATLAHDFQVLSNGVPATQMAGWEGRLSEAERWDLVAYLQTLRFGAGQVSEGKSLALEPGSPVAGRVGGWADLSGSLRRTDDELEADVRRAWKAASGARRGAEDSRSPADSLTPAQAEAVVAYVRSLAGTPRAGVPAPDPAAQAAARFRAVDSLLAAATAASRDGRPDAARSDAVAAYMQFEGLEARLGARAPGLKTRVEKEFAGFRGALGTAGLADAHASLQSALADARDVLASSPSAWALGGQSFFIILREGFEAILIIGAIVAFLLKTGNGERRRAVHFGAGVGVAASFATAAVLQGTLDVLPVNQETLEGLTMLVAVAVLFSVSYWLLSKLEHERWQAYLREKMTSALGAGSGMALGSVAFLAVYREGFETVLFYKALVGFAAGRWMPVALGFAAGCAALAVIYVLFTRYGVRIPMRPFFAVTSGVLYYMAVVFVGSGLHELQNSGVIGLTPVDWAPRVEMLGLYPTVETLAAQAGMLVLLVAALFLTLRGRPPARGAAARGKAPARGASETWGRARGREPAESRRGQEVAEVP